MSTRSRLSLSRHLQLEPGEGSTLFLLSLSLFLVIGSTAVIGRTVGRALFLSGLPSQYIPVRYLAVTVGVVLTSLLYGRISGRFRSHDLIQRTTLVMIVGLLAFRLVLGTSIASNLWILGSFYVFLEVVMALNIVQFWTFASEIFNTRQAKRLFPIVTGVSNFGSMLAGASITLLVPWLGTSNLLYVIAGMLGSNILLVRTLGRRQQASHEQSTLPTSVATQSKSGPKTAQSALGFLRTSPLLGTMAIVVVLTTLVVNIIDYQFDLSLKSSFASNPQGVSAFLGSFYFWTGIAGLVQQVFFTGPLLRRFGIVPALLIMPLSILTGSFAVLASGAAIWAVTIARSPDTVFRYTVHDTSFNLLYVPIPHQLRSQARTVIDGIFKPLTIGLAGVLFFLVNRLAGIAVLPWSYAAIVVVILGIIASLRLRPLYLQTLQDSIRRRYFGPAGEPVDLGDQTTITIIQEALRQPDEAQILHALALADEITDVDWTLPLLSLLEHESSRVRRQALRMLRRTESARHTAPSPQLRADLVRNCFADPDIHVQASAIFTYWALCGDQALEEVRPFMQHVEPKVQSAAVSGALRYGGEATRRIARPVFLSMVAHKSPSVRISAAYALGEISSEDGADLLHLLLEDSDPQVRSQAIHSAGQLADLRHLPSLLDQLGDNIVCADAADALVRYGDLLIPSLETWYATSLPDLTVRRQIPSVVARIPGPESVHFLLGRLGEADDLARARLYIALGRLCRAGAQLPEMGLAALNHRFEAETRLAYQWAVRAANPQLKFNSALLQDAYASRRRYAVDRLLYLIAMLYPQLNISQVRANLFGDDLHRRANAIEVLDTLLSRPHKERFLPLLESSPERMLEMGARLYHLVPPELESEFTAAVEGDDSWLAACTLFSLSSRQLSEFSPLIQQGLNSPHALVRETARLTASKQFEPENPITLHGYIKPDHDLHLYKQTHHRLRSLPLASGSGATPALPEEAGMDVRAKDQEGGSVMPITTMERILLLRGVALFREIPPQELEVIARLCTVVHFAPGEQFISQGDVSDGLFILVAGQVEVRANEAGVLAVRKAGEVIGEIGVLANQMRTAHCTALVETTALHIDRDDFWDLLERSSLLSVSVVRVLVPTLLSYSAKRG
jgi:ATP:ADP antiporter, AAA family